MPNRIYPVTAIALVICCFFSGDILARQAADKELYQSAMERYESGEFEEATNLFLQHLDKTSLQNAPANHLYNGACILSLGGKHDQAINILQYLVEYHLYSNLDHIQNDSDLNAIRNHVKWDTLIEQVSENQATEPERTRARIKTELLKAKELLQADGGKLWGHPIWSTDILVLNFDNTIHSLQELPDSETDGSGLFYKTVPPNTLSFTNSAQTYNGKRYGVVMSNYIDDNSATIIHELFHVLQLSHRQYRGDPVDYLDNHDARVLLRLEFQALRNALGSARQAKGSKETEAWVVDALAFRKLRQSRNRAYLDNELEIETLEGMANYTGIKLSSTPDKFQDAIDEINGREQAGTYTRPFPYATGPAYGLLFDHLELDWKSDMQTVYNFLEIFETRLGEPLSIDEAILKDARARNNFDAIYEEEQARKLTYEKNVEYYTRLLLNQPTLRASVTDGKGSYSMSFDMNGTLVLGEHGTVYSHIKGTDSSGNNFGNFNSTGEDRLGSGSAGILKRSKDGAYVFPLPTKIEGRRIVGEFYEIELNEGWEVRKDKESGDLIIAPSR